MISAYVPNQISHSEVHDVIRDMLNEKKMLEIFLYCLISRPREILVIVHRKWDIRVLFFNSKLFWLSLR